ncbi:MlaD family protein [Roseomonas sp. OT10]|uniref:MlaD family protein n=1 Tax=Roseomonas cutis TaxID=2897332 RepID=UPI001E2CABCA|nr:MlaD family protein [Roseomonas sp. OT10]UFN50988.1 MlaD family protein [Roseomonas sp. OT10]
MAAGRGLYLRVGLLILAGIALGVGFVLFFTAGRLSNDSTVLETYIRESVQGLEVGAPVRYRGVALGRVTEITLANSVYRSPGGAPFQSAFQLVVVRFGLDPERLGQETPNIEQGVRYGLRARLASQGITGVSYIELDFVDPDRFPVEAVPWQPQHPIIPSVPSTVAQVQDAAQALVRRLENIPIEAIAGNIEGLLADLRHELKDGSLAQALKGIDALVADVQRATVAADLPGLVADARAAVRDARAVVGSRDIQATLRSIREASEQASVAMRRLPDTVTSLERTLRSARGVTTDVNSDLAPVMRDLRATASNLRDTTEMLRRAPSQAILGAPPPVPDWARERGR